MGNKFKDIFIIVSLVLIGLVFLWVSIEDGTVIKFLITFGLLGYVMYFIWRTEKERAKNKAASKSMETEKHE